MPPFQPAVPHFHLVPQRASSVLLACCGSSLWCSAWRTFWFSQRASWQLITAVVIQAHTWGLRKTTANIYLLLDFVLFTFSFGFSFSYVWLASLVVRALELQSTGRGFDSRPPHCRVSALGKSFTRAPSTSEVTAVWNYINSINCIVFDILFHFMSPRFHFPINVYLILSYITKVKNRLQYTDQCGYRLKGVD